MVGISPAATPRCRAKRTAEQNAVNKWYSLPQFQVWCCVVLSPNTANSLLWSWLKLGWGSPEPYVKGSITSKNISPLFLEENAVILHGYKSGQSPLVLTDKRRQKQWVLLPSKSFESYGPPVFPSPAKRRSMSRTRASCSADFKMKKL